MARKQPPQPSVDVWYKTAGGDVFEVVAVDPEDDAIEIQYLDGSLEELDVDSWAGMDPKVIDPPHEALAENYKEEGDKGNYQDLVDLDSNDREWSGLFDEYE